MNADLVTFSVPENNNLMEIIAYGSWCQKFHPSLW